MARPTRASIDVAALRHNLARIRELSAGREVVAMVKANAYGHGLVRVGRALAAAGVDCFGVASLEEAMALREAGIHTRIMMVEGVFSPAELPAVQGNHIELVVHHAPQVEWLEQFADPTHPVRVWVKIDTGMHRLGFLPEHVAEAWQRLYHCSAVQQPVGLMTHLANADDLGDDYTRRQLRSFNAVIDGLPGPRSIANSAGLMGWPESLGDVVRPGIMLYGVSPFANGVGADYDLRPVMTLHSELIAVRPHQAGEKVGYGGTWVCPCDMPIGVVAVGYGDGYPRHAPSGTPVLVNGLRVPLIGRVSMDMVLVDLRSQPEAKPGDAVVLWGAGLPVEEVARDAGTIAYELLCHVAPRVQVELLD